ncbi:MAG: sulfite exporter TauE/SafE family protein [Erythrobacter sp.]|nr:sulfite exporter TauE/SafE family protein [Erythrobacter sp.]
MEVTAVLAALAAGALIGFILGMVGGGGSILAVPLLIYFVGVDSTHMAIGTAAVAVAINAAIGLIAHARKGNIKWGCAVVFGSSAIAGAALGAELGKSVDGARLLALFAMLMIGVGLLTMRKRSGGSDPDVKLERATARRLLPRLLPAGFGVGGFSGFFGIGGGFLIVPGLVAATAMPISVAIGSSLLVITAVGATTALSYSISGYVDWTLVALLGLGGIAGALLGRIALGALTGRGRALQLGFGGLVVAVGSAILIAEWVG